MNHSIYLALTLCFTLRETSRCYATIREWNLSLSSMDRHLPVFNFRLEGSRFLVF
jgi:hypothetical protein